MLFSEVGQLQFLPRVRSRDMRPLPLGQLYAATFLHRDGSELSDIRRK